MDNNSILTNEEQDILKMTEEYRKKILHRAFEHGAPEKASDIEAINSVLSSMDKAAYDAANTRLKHQDTQNSSVILDTIAEVIKTVQNQKQEFAIRNEQVRQISIPEEHQVTDIVPGELKTEKDELTLAEFTKGE